ncbi:MAG TPA: (2Fe-2S)-binding protein, partial [Streptomyces sp.]|nr:(2Fe-2S)-binding protein [Streptomyces sp.]
HHKEYVQPPRLAPGDGPIGPFRRWARRFYPPPPGTGGGEPARSARD